MLTRLTISNLIAFILIATMGVIAACSSPSEPLLRIGTNIWPGYEPLYLARDLGYLDESYIKLVEMTSASEVTQAIRNGTLEGAALTLDELLLLLAEGFELRVVLVLDISLGGDALLAKPNIKTLQQLRGKIIASETTAVGAVLLDGALKKAGLDMTDVKVVGCPVDEHLSCYSRADAVVTFEPTITKLQALGAHVLFDSSEIPGRIIDVLIVTKQSIEKNPRAINSLVRGYFQATKYIEHNNENAAEKMSKRLRLNTSEVIASFSGLKLASLETNRSMLQGKHSTLKNSAEKLSELMRDRKLLGRSPSLKNFTTGKFLPATNP